MLGKMCVTRHDLAMCACVWWVVEGAQWLRLTLGRSFHPEQQPPCPGHTPSIFPATADNARCAYETGTNRRRYSTEKIAGNALQSIQIILYDINILSSYERSNFGAKIHYRQQV